LPPPAAFDTGQIRPAASLPFAAGQTFTRIRAALRPLQNGSGQSAQTAGWAAPRSTAAST